MARRSSAGRSERAPDGRTGWVRVLLDLYRHRRDARADLKVSYGAQAPCTATPVNAGSTPAASIPAVPRLACTVINEYFGVEAEWTQCSLPATRKPVSSKVRHRRLGC
jgi:hypothetical protein